MHQNALCLVDLNIGPYWHSPAMGQPCDCKHHQCACASAGACPAHDVHALADRGSVPRCCSRAPRRSMRWRRQLSSASPRRWRVSARSSPSRCAACCARAAVGCNARAWFGRECTQRVCAIDRERDGCTCSACGSMGHGVVLLHWRQACLSMKGLALLTERCPLARCTKRAPSWTRRAARRRRQPCARPWRWASGGCALARCLACLFMCTFTTHSASDMPPSSYRARPRGSWHGFLAQWCMPHAADKGTARQNRG